MAYKMVYLMVLSCLAISGLSSPVNISYLVDGEDLMLPTSPPLLPLHKRAEGGPTGDWTCKGAAKQRQNLYNNGGDPIDASIASLEQGENNCNGGDTFSSNYKFGDGKTGDSANCGPYKNNWNAIKTHCGNIVRRDDWQKGCQELNEDPNKATQCQQQQRKTLGDEGFFQTQRCGHLCDDTEQGRQCGNSGDCVTGAKQYGDAVNHIGKTVKNNPDTDRTGGYQLAPI